MACSKSSATLIRQRKFAFTEDIERQLRTSTPPFIYHQGEYVYTGSLILVELSIILFFVVTITYLPTYITPIHILNCAKSLTIFEASIYIHYTMPSTLMLFSLFGVEAHNA